MAFSGIIKEIFAPVEDPITAAIKAGTASLKLTKPAFINLIVANAVPKVDDILLVAMQACGGSPAIIYAGKEISPPPPPMASIKPARKTSGQTIRYVSKLMINRYFFLLLRILYCIINTAIRRRVKVPPRATKRTVSVDTFLLN